MTTKMNGKTARQWLVEMAHSHMRLYRTSAHMALEAVYDQSLAPNVHANSLYKFAASAYEGITQRQLERLIASVEKL